MYIYADNAATTKTSQAAIKAMNECMEDFYGNPSSLHSVGQRAAEKLLQARMDVAECLGADFKEIYFTSGGSEADNQAIVSAATFGAKKGKKHIISTKIEHHAVLHTLAKLEKQGFEVTLLDVNEKGEVDPKAVEDAIREDTALVSIMYANNEIGTVEPIKELVDTAKKSGALFHTDAVQAVGHIPIYANETGFDFLSASAHKFNGPKGIGFLYYRGGDILQPFTDGGAQEFGMRAGTENVAAIVGMAEALKWNTEFMTANTAHLDRLTEVFLDGIKSIDYLFNGDPVNRLPGNINISIRGKSGEGLLHLLDLKGIMISTGSACDSVNTQVSHVVQAIGVDKNYAEGTIRITFGHENTEEEARTLAATLIQLVKM